MRYAIYTGLLFSWAAMAVIGGTDLENGASLASHVVALQMKDLDDPQAVAFHKGSAFLIAPDILLTAAHNVACLNGHSERVTAIFDSHPIWGETHPGQESRIARRFYFHPAFALINHGPNKGTINDIAIVVLESQAPQRMRPLPIALHPSYLPQIGTLSVNAGYGVSQQISPIDPNDLRLREVALDYLGGENGQEFFVSPKLVVDQSHGKGFCRGDSGSPLMFDVAGVLTAYGIAIHTGQNIAGDQDCLTKGYFTNIAYYADWIEGVITMVKNGEDTSNPPSPKECNGL